MIPYKHCPLPNSATLCTHTRFEFIYFILLEDHTGTISKCDQNDSNPQTNLFLAHQASSVTGQDGLVETPPMK